MDAGQVVTVARQTIWVIVKTSVPLLLVSMIVGLIISLFQTLTSIQEQTLTFVPKLLAVMIALMIMGNWLLNEIVSVQLSEDARKVFMNQQEKIDVYPIERVILLDDKTVLSDR